MKKNIIKTCICKEGSAWASHLRDYPDIKRLWNYCPHCGKPVKKRSK